MLEICEEMLSASVNKVIVLLVRICDIELLCSGAEFTLLGLLDEFSGKWNG